MAAERKARKGHTLLLQLKKEADGVITLRPVKPLTEEDRRLLAESRRTLRQGALFDPAAGGPGAGQTEMFGG